MYPPSCYWKPGLAVFMTLFVPVFVTQRHPQVDRVQSGRQSTNGSSICTHDMLGHPAALGLRE
jgi:hypothetical protein